VRVVLTGATDLHGVLRSEANRISDEIQAAAHRCGEDVWVERVKIATSQPETAGGGAPVSSALDVRAMLTGIEADPAVRGRATEMLASISVRLPGGMEREGPPLAEDLDSLLDEARALILGRTAPQATC
jgi:hypothetical protein